MSESEIIPLAVAAKRTKCSRRILCHLVAEGLVPFAELTGKQWILQPRSIEFLNEHYSKKIRNKLRGKGGHEKRRQIAELAAQLDPVCAERAANTKPQWWTRKKEKQD